MMMMTFCCNQNDKRIDIKAKKRDINQNISYSRMNRMKMIMDLPLLHCVPNGSQRTQINQSALKSIEIFFSLYVMNYFTAAPFSSSPSKEFISNNQFIYLYIYIYSALLSLGITTLFTYTYTYTCRLDDRRKWSICVYNTNIYACAARSISVRNTTTQPAHINFNNANQIHRLFSIVISLCFD